METKNINDMETELKKAFELIKENCSREEQIKALFIDKDGDVDLMNLKLKGFNVLLTGLEAKGIFNNDQEAGYIINDGQKARVLTNDKGDVDLNDLNLRGNKVSIHGLKADEIYNLGQKADEFINNEESQETTITIEHPELGSWEIKSNPLID